MTYFSSERTMTSVTVSPLTSARSLAASHRGCGTRTERNGVFGWFGISDHPVRFVRWEAVPPVTLVCPVDVTTAEHVVRRSVPLRRLDSFVGALTDSRPPVTGDSDLGSDVLVGELHLGSLPGRCIYTLPRCIDTRQGFTRKEST